MKKSEAVRLHAKYKDRYPVFVRQIDGHLVANVKGREVKAKTQWQLDTALEGVAPTPRNLYFIDSED